MLLAIPDPANPKTAVELIICIEPYDGRGIHAVWGSLGQFTALMFD